ncbi:MAG: CPBP family intramembrane glutamic endopeptidase [Acidobacteriota bacterium]
MRSWGAFASLALTAVLFVLYSLLQAAGLAAVSIAEANTGGNPFAGVTNHFGTMLWAGILIAAPITLAAIYFLVRVRRPQGVLEYLGWVSFRWPGALLGLAAILATSFTFDALSRGLDRPPIPAFVEMAMTTAGSLPALIFAIVVVAPLFEEVLFRGFLFTGLANSAAGTWGAVLITSLLFSVIHLQYDLFDMSSIFILGLILGAVRALTDSTRLAFLLHAAVNLLAVGQAALYLWGDA